jgi:cation:H+ antiporter
MVWIAFLLIAGLVLLIVGAELLVRGASTLARRMGISALVIGLTVVAFGTSAPELSVSLYAVFNGQPDIALGNAVGSNSFNILFILGLSALVAPLAISRQLVRFDLIVMICVAALTVLLGLDGRIGRLDGLLLGILFVVYILFLARQSRKNGVTNGNGSPPAETDGKGGKRIYLIRDIIYILLGLVLLVAGSRILVTGAVSIARALNVSDLVIALTIVAAGTSLPELFTSLVASLRGERDIAVGNVVGSNIFNLFVVLGFSAALAPDGIAVSTQAIQLDMPVMLLASLICLPIFFTGYRIDRWEGLLFLGYYIVYSVYLFLQATASEILPAFKYVVFFVLAPLTLLFLVHTVRLHLKQARLQNSCKDIEK